MFLSPRQPPAAPFRPTEPPHFRRGLLLTGVCTLGLGLLLVGLPACDQKPRPADPVAVEPPPEVQAPVVWPLARLRHASAQTNLLDSPITTFIQPTESGRSESGLYGSVRTANTGGRIHPSFHEGIDIKPMARDRAGKPLDDVVAIADGRVAYLNKHSGNSNYGLYVVLLHDDAMGEVYSLYSHLASVPSGLRVGAAVEAGTVLGRMGNTPSRIIPMARAHLHFEIGVVLNQGFERYMASIKTRNDHGRYNGWNLIGTDPLTVYADQRAAGASFSLQAHLEQQPVAAELVMAAARLPDYFVRHPVLWAGGAYAGPALVVSLSHGGVPLRGRAATAEEAALLKGRTPRVLNADPNVIGRNGRRLVQAGRDGWTLGSQGQRWADIFLFGCQ